MRDRGQMAFLTPRPASLLATVVVLWSITASSPARAQQQEWPDQDPWGRPAQQQQPAQQPAQGGPHGGFAQPAPAEPPPPAEPPAPSLLETSTHLIDLAVVFGFTTEESFDDALRAHGYQPSPGVGVFGADVTSLWRVLPVLWLGGRLGYRARAWAQPGVDSVDAFAVAGWVVADLRLALGRVWELGLSAALGGATVGINMNRATDYHPAPSAAGHLTLGVKLGGPVRALWRFGYEYLEAVDVNPWGHDVNLSGGSFAVGVEIRR